MAELGALHLLLYDGATFSEVAPLLAFSWTSRAVYSAGGAPVRTSDGLTLLPNHPLEALDAVSDGAVVIPGGDPSSLVEAPEVMAALATTLARLATCEAVTLAAICNGALVLGRAGILDGQHCTHTACAPYAARPEFAALLDFSERWLGSAQWVDEDVVIQGRLITAKPWAALAFARAVARAAGQDRDGAAARYRYLRGQRDRPGLAPYERCVVSLTAVPGSALSRDLVVAHVAWLRALEATGALELAGPVTPAGPDDPPAGLVVVRSESLEAAEALAATDPFVRAGVRTARVRRWSLSCDDNGHMID